MKIAASDYDGTLRRFGKRVTKSDIKAIEKWRKAGNLFGFVTGRGSNFVDVVREKEIEFDFMILLNGALILNSKAEVIYESRIPADAVKALADECSKAINIEEYDKYEGTDTDLYYGRFPTDEETFAFSNHLNEIMGDKITSYANGNNLNVVTKDEGKANGIYNISKMMNVNKEDIYVFGDDYNDMEMIEKFDGYAVINARKEVKAVAPHIVFSVGSMLNKILNQK